MGGIYTYWRTERSCKSHKFVTFCDFSKVYVPYFVKQCCPSLVEKEKREVATEPYVVMISFDRFNHCNIQLWLVYTFHSTFMASLNMHHSFLISWKHCNIPWDWFQTLQQPMGLVSNISTSVCDWWLKYCTIPLSLFSNIVTSLCELFSNIVTSLCDLYQTL